MSITSTEIKIMSFFILIILFVLVTGPFTLAIEPDNSLGKKPDSLGNEVVKISFLDYNYFDDQINSGSRAIINQTGDSNYALIDQVSQNNLAWINQFDNNNSTKIFQEGINNFGYTAQIGDNNFAEIIQNNDEGYRFAFIGQVGDNNNASIEQGGFIGQFGNENEAHILQDGPVEFETEIQQNGDSNIAGVMALGQSKNLAVEQHGDNQNIEILTGQ